MEGQRSALPSAPFHSGVRGCHHTEALAGKCPAGSPLLRGYGGVGWGAVPAQPRPGPPPSDVLRLRARLLAQISAPPPAGQEGTPIGARRPQARSAPLAAWIGPTAYLRTNGVRPYPRPRPLHRRGRATALSLRCALWDPHPLRARSSPRPPPPVTCAARMWLGADVGARCGPGPAHPRGWAAHTEPRRARRLSRLPQCAARLRPRLGEVVPNVAARHP